MLDYTTIILNASYPLSVYLRFLFTLPLPNSFVRAAYLFLLNFSRPFDTSSFSAVSAYVDVYVYVRGGVIHLLIFFHSRTFPFGSWSL